MRAPKLKNAVFFWKAIEPTCESFTYFNDEKRLRIRIIYISKKWEANIDNECSTVCSKSNLYQHFNGWKDDYKTLEELKNLIETFIDSYTPVTPEQSFEELKEQTKGLTCLLCNQGFDETMLDCIEDNDYDEDSYGQRCLKEDVLFRLLDENLDYGKFNETEDELNDDKFRSERLEQRCFICEQIATAWVDGEVKNFKQAQELATIISDCLRK